MSAAVAGGREVAARAMGFLQTRSIGFFFRSLSNAPTPETKTTKTELGDSIKQTKKKKNFFEVAQLLPNRGVGCQMAKNHWNGTYYKITKVDLYEDGRSGSAWGVLHKDGMPCAEEMKITGVRSPNWRYVPESRKKL